MTRLRWQTTGAALLGLLLAAPAARPAPVPGERGGLDQVPASAPIVVHLRGVEGTKDRIIALVKNALPEVAPQVEERLQSWWKDGIDGRKFRGLAKDGPVYLAFTEVPKRGVNPPPFAVIAAVTSYTEFRDGFLKEDERKGLKEVAKGIEKATEANGSSDIYFVNKKDFAVLTPTEDIAKAFAKKQAGLDGRLSKELAGKLLAADVGVYLAVDAFNKDYAEQIKQAKEAIDGVLKQAEENVGKSQKSSIDLARKALGPIFQAVEDSQGVLVTLEFRPSGLALHAQTEIKSGSATAKALAGAKPNAFAGLGRLPAGQLYYSGIQTGPALYKVLGPFMFGAMAADDPDAAKKIQAATDELMQAGPGARIDGFSLPPAGVQVYHYQDPAKAVDGQLKMLQAMSAGATLQSGMLKKKPVVKKNAQKYRDFELHSVHLEWDLEKMAEASGAGAGALPEEARKQLAEGMKKLMGSEMNLWFGSDGKDNVTVIAKDWPAAEKLLDQYFKGEKKVGDVAAFREARKELPAEATVLALFDVVQYAAAVLDFVKPLIGGAMPLPPNFPAAPDKAKPTYMGLAATAVPERASFDLFLSAPAVHEFYKVFIAPLRAGAN
jgi:hypothetical protein